MIPVEAIRFRC